MPAGRLARPDVPVNSSITMVSITMAPAADQLDWQGRALKQDFALVCGMDPGQTLAAEALKALLNLAGGFHGMLADRAWRIVPRFAPPNAAK